MHSAADSTKPVRTQLHSLFLLLRPNTLLIHFYPLTMPSHLSITGQKLRTVFTLKASLYLYNPMVHRIWVGRHKFTLNYIILGQTTVDSHAPHPHFTGSLHYIDQNLGFKPQNPTMGGSAAQQTPRDRVPTIG